MALPEIQFSLTYDIHLLRGMSVNLMDRLMVGNINATQFKVNNPGVVYKFNPFFKRTAGADNIFTGSNITVDTDTGLITTIAAAPIPEKRNFLVQAVAELGVEKQETLIRIHIHHSIDEAWLSPSLLTVQKITGNIVRFSVRVRFDDDVVADISRGSTFNTVSSNLYQIAWSHPTIPTLVNNNSGIIDSSVVPTTGELPDPVQATITPSAGSPAVANGKVFIADQLSGTNPDVKAQLVTSGRSPGFVKAREVPNVLFIPDGFTSEDKNVFNRIIDDYVSDLSKGKIAAPFDMLAGSMNFYKVFLASGDRGITTKCDVYVKEVDGKLKGTPLPRPVKPIKEDKTPDDNAANWYYYHLLYHVGLPLKADVSPLVRTNAVLRAEWKLTTLLSVGQVNDITDSAIENWRKVGQRRLPEERDTVLGIYVDNHSALKDYDGFNSFAFNDKRVSRAGLNSFFRNLRDTDNNTIGRFFISPFSNALQGKDYKNVIIISAANTGRAQNSDGVIFVPINDLDGPFEMEGNDITLLKMGINFNNEVDELGARKRGTITHELAHSFALEDEYGEDLPDSSYNGKFITDQLAEKFPSARYSKPASAVDWSSNVVARADLLSLNTNNPTTNMVDANKLKWRYHRIDKCGVVVSAITGTPAQYKLNVRPGHTEGFAAGNKLFLRKRTVFTYRVSRSAAPSVPAQNVQTLSPDSIYLSDAQITNVNAGSNQITISDTDGTSYTITFEFPGSAARFNSGDAVEIERWIRNEPIYSFSRTSPPAPNNPAVSDTIIPSISQELELISLNATTNETVFKTLDNQPLRAEFLNAPIGSEIIIYKPMDAPSSVRTGTYKYAEIISKKVLDYLVSKPFPFNGKPDAANGNAITEVIDDDSPQDSSIPGSLVPSCSSQKKRIVSFYSNGDQYHGNVYHPTGQCFMREYYDDGSYEEFCSVCKYTLVNMIDPRKHDENNSKISKKIYPT